MGKVGVSVAIGSSAVCLVWSIGRALAARSAGSAPSRMWPIGLEYDIGAALEEPDDH
jgi:hypothetical protein